MKSISGQSNILIRHRIQGEVATLVQRAAYDHRLILLQTDDGSQAVLVPFDPEQIYFWTPEWQAAEREVDAQLLAGDYEDFATMEDFIASLKETPEQTDAGTE
ncbi:MAG: hypothetical protein U9Q70_01260 [Chloroflexota bacterium]|nr:hypothetical protein [Chloroflexota bacterium]